MEAICSNCGAFVERNVDKTYSCLSCGIVWFDEDEFSGIKEHDDCGGVS